MSKDYQVHNPYACDCIFEKIAEISLFRKFLKMYLNIEYY